MLWGKMQYPHGFFFHSGVALQYILDSEEKKDET